MKMRVLFVCMALSPLASAQTITITNTVEEIFPSAYRFDVSTAIDMSDATSLLTIGDNGFRNMFNLVSVDFSGATSLTTIGIQAFATSGLSALDFTGLSALTSMLGSTFNTCFNLVSVSNWHRMTSLQSIGPNAFQASPVDTEVDLSGNTALTSIGTFAFADTAIQTFIFPYGQAPGTLSLGEEALSGADLAGTFYVPASVTFTGINVIGWIDGNALDTVVFDGQTFTTNMIQSVPSLHTIMIKGVSTNANVAVNAFSGVAGLSTVVLFEETVISAQLFSNTPFAGFSGTKAAGTYTNGGNTYSATLPTEPMQPTGAHGQAGGATGDPHIVFAHGGRADFRGKHMQLYNFFSTPSLSLNVRTEEADFRLGQKKQLLVHGSFITEAHVVGANGFKLSMYAHALNEHNYGWKSANATCGGPDNDAQWYFVFAHTRHTCMLPPSVAIERDYATITVSNEEWQLVVSSKPVYDHVAGPKHRLDIKVKPLLTRASKAHGILGQAFSVVRRDGKRDEYPLKEGGEYTTSAMAEGAIDGTAADYEVDKPYATEFKYSLFGAQGMNEYVQHMVASEVIDEFDEAYM